MYDCAGTATREGFAAEWPVSAGALVKALGSSDTSIATGAAVGVGGAVGRGGWFRLGAGSTEGAGGGVGVLRDVEANAAGTNRPGFTTLRETADGSPPTFVDACTAFNMGVGAEADGAWAGAGGMTTLKER